MSTHESEQTAEIVLSAAQIEDLQTSFAMCDPLTFAKHLHCLDIPDSIKGEWLRLKMSQKPTEREDAMRNAIESAMSRFWARLGAKQ